MSIKHRKIDRLILHCSATPPTMDIGAREIRRWHLARGWSDIGYHYVIRRDGEVEPGRAEAVIGAHTRGFNHGSLGICLVGGLTEEGMALFNFTDAQMIALKALLKELLARYEGATLHGHNEFADKACPCFDVAVWAEGLQ
ncbi:MAG: lysozyme [Alphaproteobacteria bacterium]|nr:MAG: lysozyme [Alphaproteobacteria bacterium]